MYEVFAVGISSRVNHILTCLPMPPCELLDVLDQLQLQSDEIPLVGIDVCMNSFEFLCAEMHWDYSLKEVNDLATRLSQLDKKGQIAFEGLVKMETDRIDGAIPVGKLIDLAYSVDCCDVHPGVKTYEELGRFCVEQGLFSDLKSIPEEDHPFLDYEKIGEKFSKEKGGILVSGGYVLRTSDIKQVSHTLDPKPQYPSYAILLKISKGHFNDPQYDNDKTVQLPLPASPQALDTALDAIGAWDWREVGFCCLDCRVPSLVDFIGDDDDIAQINQLAGTLAEMDDKQLIKLKAVMDATEDHSVLGATHIAANLDDYLFTPQYLGSEEIAKDYIQSHIGDPTASKLLPFIQLERYGETLMEEQVYALTDYGVVSRKDGQRLHTFQGPAAPVQGGMEVM